MKTILSSKDEILGFIQFKEQFHQARFLFMKGINQTRSEDKKAVEEAISIQKKVVNQAENLLLKLKNELKKIQNPVVDIENSKKEKNDSNIDFSKDLKLSEPEIIEISSTIQRKLLLCYKRLSKFILRNVENTTKQSTTEINALQAKNIKNRVSGTETINYNQEILKRMLFEKKIKELEKAISYLNLGLELNPGNKQKADLLYRRANARTYQQKYSEALDDIKKAIELFPKNKNYQTQLKETEALKEGRIVEKYSSSFDGSSGTNYSISSQPKIIDLTKDSYEEDIEEAKALSLIETTEDSQLQQALLASLQTSNSQFQDEDEEIQKAIQLSLQENNNTAKIEKKKEKPLVNTTTGNFVFMSQGEEEEEDDEDEDEDEID